MVFESIIALFQAYGLFGLFITSIISSLFFFPGLSPLLIPFYSLQFPSWQIFIAITSGSIIGGFINYYIGFFGYEIFYVRKIKKSHDWQRRMKSAKNWSNKWGKFSVLIANAIPFFPADFLNLFVGFFRQDIKLFLLGMSIGKAIQFAILVFAAGILI